MKLTLSEAKRRLTDSGFQILSEERVRIGTRLECDGGIKVLIYDDGTFYSWGKPGDLLDHANKVLSDQGVKVAFSDQPEREILGMVADLRGAYDAFEAALLVISRNEAVDPVLYAKSVLQKARTPRATSGLPQGAEVHG